MYRYLRTTRWPPDLKPFTIVVAEVDVTCPLEEIGYPGGDFSFVKQDIFSHESGDIAMATVVGNSRMHAQLITERNQAIMFFWLTQQMPMVKEGGVLGTGRPAPFSAAEVREVFKQLCELREYRGFTLTAVAEDGTPVSMKEGHDA